MKLPASIQEAGILLRNGSITCVTLAETYLQIIKRLNPLLNALITVTDEQALETAQTLDKEFTSGNDRGPLHGIPIVHKDLYDTAGTVTSRGSGLYRKRIPETDATVVSQLRAAGTVLMGKANMTEFASDGSGKNVFFGDVRNPWDIERSAGGSSSGTAAAIAAGMCLGGTGSDTGGSIRIPASWCGLVGIRPTYGLVSMVGAFPRAYSLDCGGPLALTVHDAATLLNAMVDLDFCRANSVRPVDYAKSCAGGVKGLRLATIENFTYRDVDDEVANAVHSVVIELTRLGASMRSVKIPALSGPLDYSSLFNLLLYEFSQILGDEYRASRAREKSFGPIVRANLERGSQVTREAYERALSDRPKHIADFRRIFADVDALVTPTLPMVAPLLTETAETYDRGRQFNIPISYLGLPSISVPCGFSPSGLPIGILIIGDAFQESLITRVAAACERARHDETATLPLSVKSVLSIALRAS